MKQTIITLCIICATILMCGCLNESSDRTYIGYPLDVGFLNGGYMQYENVINVEKVYEERGYYSRKITFCDGSWQTYNYVVDEKITKGLLYNSMKLSFRDGHVEYLDYVIGYETESIQEGYWDITLTFADGSKKALHYVTSYKSL